MSIFDMIKGLIRHEKPKVLKSKPFKASSSSSKEAADEALKLFFFNRK